MLEHALSAERIGPKGFIKCLEIIVKKIAEGPLQFPAATTSDDSLGGTGHLQTLFPTTDDVSWLVDTFFASEQRRTKAIFLEAIALSGFGGKIAIEKSTSVTSVELVSGYTFKHISQVKSPSRLVSPKVLCIDGYAESVHEMNSFLEESAATKEQVVLFIRGAADDVLNTINVNNKRGAFSIHPIIVEYDVEGINALNDIATVCGCDLLSTHKGDTFAQLSVNAAPRIESIVIDRGSVNVKNQQTNRNVSMHVAKLMRKRDESNHDVYLLLDKRIRSLTPRHVVIRLEDDRNFVKETQAIDYALRAYRSLIDHGTVIVNGEKRLAATQQAATLYSNKCIRLLSQLGAVLLTSLVFLHRQAY